MIIIENKEKIKTLVELILLFYTAANREEGFEFSGVAEDK